MAWVGHTLMPFPMISLAQASQYHCCIMLRHKAIGLNGDLVTLTETNFKWIVVISKRLKTNGDTELSKKHTI